MMAEYMIETALKAQNWELAKGRLRAQVALAGAAGVSEYRGGPVDLRWKQLDAVVENFIGVVEDEGLHE